MKVGDVVEFGDSLGTIIEINGTIYKIECLDRNGLHHHYLHPEYLTPTKPTCKTCKHWTELKRLKTGYCNKIDEDTKELAYIELSNSTAAASFLCQPNFGCNLHVE